MSASVQTTEPRRITAGDTITWKRQFSDYLPSDGWTLSYAGVSPAGNISISSEPSDAYHLVSIPAATSAQYNAGEYLFQAYVTHTDGRRFQVGQTPIVIRPNFATAAGGAEVRSNARQILDALNAMILGKATKDQASISINTPDGGRSISRMTPEEIIRWRDIYKREVKSEEFADSLEFGGRGRCSKMRVRM